ncbi:MAG: PaaI family thioesterase [Acidobacteria bacterium]|nr:PaaI family thioesterase [Acidobacteriota bacterium]
MTEGALTAVERERILDAFAAVPFARVLGIELESVERGEAVVRLEIRDELRQNHGIIHGGVTASLIDTAAAFVIMTQLEEGQTTTTVDLTIHYLRPLVRGSATARARIVRGGRRIIIAAVDVYDDAKILAATALTTYIRLT